MAAASSGVQDVFTKLVRKLPEFRYNPDQSFRNWLRIVLLNTWREHLRRAAPVVPGELAEVAAPKDSHAFEEVEYGQALVRQALEVMQCEFSRTTCKVCREHVVAGRAAAEVAAELGISVGSVYVAKSRGLGRLRVELTGLFD